MIYANVIGFNVTHNEDTIAIIAKLAADPTSAAAQDFTTPLLVRYAITYILNTDAMPTVANTRFITGEFALDVFGNPANFEFRKTWTLPAPNANERVHSSEIVLLTSSGNTTNFISRSKEPIPSTPLGFIPNRRAGSYRIAQFTKMDAIEKLANGNFKIRDLDFVDTQARSMAQAARKMRAIAESTDQSLTLQCRIKSATNEFSARRGLNFNEYLIESARVIEFAVNEIRTEQKFDLTNITVNRLL